MKVILKENVESLGRMGDVLEVAGGYARNYLIPRNLAVAATERNVRTLDHEKRLIDERIRKETKVAEDFAGQLREVSLRISVKAGEIRAEKVPKKEGSKEAGSEEDGPKEEGPKKESVKIFGSVTSKDIVEALAKEGITVDKRAVLLEHPIKELGTFKVPVKVHPDVTAEVSVSVVEAS